MTKQEKQPKAISNSLRTDEAYQQHDGEETAETSTGEKHADERVERNSKEQLLIKSHNGGDKSK